MRFARPSSQELSRLDWRRFRTAAEWIARAFSTRPEVQKVALFGSIARPANPRHRYHDVDLAVWLWDVRDLRGLSRVQSRTLQELFAATDRGVANHQVDMFLFQPGTNRYLGRLCSFSSCPKWKKECTVPACGDTPFLQQHRNFALRADALRNAVVLLERPANERPFVESGRENSLDVSWEEAVSRFGLSLEHAKVGRQVDADVRSFLVHAKSIRPRL